jgi:hypothetical protein
MFHASKLRNTVAIFAAVSSVAVATGPITPAASAQKNDGRYQKSAEAKHKKLCASLQGSFDDLLLIAEQNVNEGNTNDANRAMTDAESVKGAAQGAKCGWAG